MQGAMGNQFFEPLDGARRSVSHLPDLLRNPRSLENPACPLLLVRQVPLEIRALRKIGSKES